MQLVNPNDLVLFTLNCNFMKGTFTVEGRREDEKWFWAYAVQKLQRKNVVQFGDVICLYGPTELIIKFAHDLEREHGHLP